ncbi:MAG: hypothetical protein AB7V45_07020 [Candidatus Krumholzibacteriia bacterium]
MSIDLKLFLKKLGLFLIPFALYGLAILVVDPFNYFAVPSPIADQLKQEISFKLNYAMWKMFEFRRQPMSNILLGDSRMMTLKPDLIEAICGRPYYNFAYGGGSLKEAVATFWYANELTDLKSVVIGLDLNTYNGSDFKDRVSEVEGAIHNPFLYLTNNTVMISAWKVVVSSLTGTVDRIGQPVGDRESFWRHQLDVTAKVNFGNYKKPVAYRNQLQTIADFCRSRDIELVFIIFPSHRDLMDKIDDYGLRPDDQAMREDLARLGKVFDFAWDNELTRDRTAFKDPYHFTPEVEEEIIRTVWGGGNFFVRIYGQGVAFPEPPSHDAES